VNSDGEEVTSDGKSLDTRATATGKARKPTDRKSNSRKKQTVGDWGPESVPRRDVGGANELLQLLQSLTILSYGTIWLDSQDITLLTLWRPLLPHGYGYKASCARPGYAVNCNFRHPGNLTLSPERQSARMSKITNDGITRSGTGCFIVVHTCNSGRQRVSKVAIKCTLHNIK